MKTVAEYNWGENDQAPWTIIGKGPSFQTLLDCSPPGFRMGINHVVKECKVNVGIFMDLENLCEMREYLQRNVQAVFLPQILHVGAKFNGVRTESLDIPVIRENDVYVFDGSNVKNNTAEAGVMLICKHSACRRMITVGIDGGRDYHKLFDASPIGPKIDNKPQLVTIENMTKTNDVIWQKWQYDVSKK